MIGSVEGMRALRTAPLGALFTLGPTQPIDRDLASRLTAAISVNGALHRGHALFQSTVRGHRLLSIVSARRRLAETAGGLRRHAYAQSRAAETRERCRGGVAERAGFEPAVRF